MDLAVIDGEYSDLRDEEVGSDLSDEEEEQASLQYRIDHRPSNALLTLYLSPGYHLKARPGSLVAMDTSVQLHGELYHGFTRLVSGEDISELTFVGPGEVLLAPDFWGDITPVELQDSTVFCIKGQGFLACSGLITRKSLAQGFPKSLLDGGSQSAEQLSGSGIVFMQAAGAVVERQLAYGEQWVVDASHLLAWSASYTAERSHTGCRHYGPAAEEAWVCRFTGPGVVYIQTRVPENVQNSTSHLSATSSAKPNQRGS
ncbi:hypothetical protein M407DRAFT_247004 [Tulasnella calospora MUT 4182]|uniref:Altered inheritance of mitochondria protein 24, mitochondrial n=2 Tax=Tulasnella calospora MUT 4182 TaxID=1051891 RepID=A0A0C3PPE0_9AGAM|nr:hypothetical protein M407DRAFT_247004 [Tulasnella calospora MUT 4182]